MWMDVVIRKILGFSGENLRHYFDDLELDKVIPRLLQFVFERAKCENITWVTAAEFDRVRLSESSENPLKGETLVDRHLKVQSVKSVDDELLYQVISQFTEKASMPAAAHVNGHTYVLVPIKSVKTHEPIAYLILHQVLSVKPEKVMVKISRDISYMEKHIGFAMQFWEAQQMSLHDDLTNLYNQKYMMPVLESEIAQAQREQSKFTVLFMDIDYFKAVNDTRGHWVGSKLLVEVSRILKANLRRCDYAFRFGGDEFVVVLPQTDTEAAIPAAERFRNAIEKTNFIIDGEELQLTLSIGLACFPDHARTYKDILQIADAAMYSGKIKSRNIVFVAS